MTDITLYRGEKKVYECTATEGGTAVNLTGATVYFAVWPDYPASSVLADTYAMIAKSTADDIALTTPASGIFEITFEKADTNTLEPGEYVCGFEYIPSGETEPRVLAQGTFTILADVVRAA